VIEKDQEPAFPNTGYEAWGPEASPGMTLRDWFASQALASTLSNIEEQVFIDLTAPDSRACRVFARVAYAVADAMLAERER